jgi:hypothetical protein
MITPDTIYHYTTITGLIGIITKLELWVSDCRFLNDGTEISYAQDIFYAEVGRLSLNLTQEDGYVIAGSSIDRIHMLVACFCEDGDLLSQWRGYGLDQGYAIGFDVALLKALNIGEIRPVKYGIENPSEYFAEELSLASVPTAHPGVREWYDSMGILPRLASVKHPGFAEEHEWRLLRHEPNEGRFEEQNAKLQFRPSSMGPIAYLAIHFSPECIREIVIGPGSYTNIRESAIRGMLWEQDLRNVSTRTSTIPFRR